MTDGYIKRTAAKSVMAIATLDGYSTRLINTALDNIPDEDVRPVVHAKITADGACSACGSYMPTDTRRDAIFGDEVHFCYCCGATMDGEAHDHEEPGI